MSTFNLTKGQSQDADRLFRFLLSQDEFTAVSEKAGEEAFAAPKNLDQVNELLRLIEENQPQELIRLDKQEDNDWIIYGTGLLPTFMERGRMEFHWEGQMARAKEIAIKQQEKEKIEREALELDIELKKNIIDDYPKTKARAKRSEYIAWGSVILALAALFIQLYL